MKPVIELINDVLARPPGDLVERITPWVFVILGGLFLLIMAYSYWMAPLSL